MIAPVPRIDGHQAMSNHMHSPDHSLQRDFSWLNLEHDTEDDATTIYDSSEVDESGNDTDDTGNDATTMYEGSDLDESDHDAEILRRTMAHHHSDQLPLAWRLEAERETPEREEPLNVPSTTLTTAPTARQDSCPAHSAAPESTHQGLYIEPNSLEDLVCGIEVWHNFLKGERLYRKKNLEWCVVSHAELSNILDRKCVHMLFYGDEEFQVGKFQFDPITETLKDFTVVVASDWSDWKPMDGESYKADQALYDFYKNQVLEQAF
ncbi:hypothetical protein B0J12DRAFT_769117, partial [Macrophomina phaseolina]